MHRPHRVSRLALIGILSAALLVAPLTATASPTVSPADRPGAPIDLGEDMRAVPGVEAPPAAETGARIAAEVHTLDVSVAATTTTTADDVNVVNASAISAYVQALNAYWQLQSDGAISVVLGNIEARSTKQPCDIATLYDTYTQAAFGGAYADYSWVGTNKHLMVLTREDCPGNSGGIGSVGGAGGQLVSEVGVAPGDGYSVGFHEFGHNLGFGHADSSICRSTSQFDGTYAELTAAGARCPTEEYADILDIMGFSGSTANLSSPGRIIAGYMTDFVALGPDAFGPTTVTLSPLSDAPSTRAIQITDPVNGELYFIEYRVAESNDSTSAEFTSASPYCGDWGGGYYKCESDMDPAVGGVRILRVLPYEYSFDTTVLAVAPVGSSAFVRHGWLAAGQSFTSLSGSFTVTVNSISAAAGASVTVTPPIHATTTRLTTSTPTQTFGSLGAALTATVLKVGTVRPQGTMTFKDGATVLGTVPTNATTGVATFRVPSTLTVGSHSLTATFTPTGNFSASTSPAVAVTVKKATSNSTITLTRSTILTKTAWTLTVKVTVPGVPAPTGGLTVYSGNTVIATGTLLAESNGVQLISVPGFSTAGVRTISVKYNGDANITGYRSASKQLTVKANSAV